MNTGGSVKGFSPLLKNCVNHCFNSQFLSCASPGLPHTVINSGDEFADKWHVDLNFSYLADPGAGLHISTVEALTINTSSFYGGIKAVVGNITNPSYTIDDHSVWQKIPKDLCVGQVVTFSCDVLTSLPNVKIGIFKREISGGVLTEFTDVRGSYNHPGDGRSHRLWITTSLLPDDVNFGELVIYISCAGFTPYKLIGGSLTLFEAGNCSFAVGGYDVLPYIASRDKHSDEVMNDSVIVGRTVTDALSGFAGYTSSWVEAGIAVDNTKPLKIEAAYGGGSVTNIGTGTLLVTPRFMCAGKTIIMNGMLWLQTVSGTVNVIRIYVRDPGSLAIRNPKRTAITSYTIHLPLGVLITSVDADSIKPSLMGMVYSTDDIDGLFVMKADGSSFTSSEYLEFNAVYEIA